MSLARSEAKPLILIVEDEVELAKLISWHLSDSGMLTHLCHRAEEAKKFIRENFVNLVLLDVDLPDQSGFGLLEDMKQEGKSVPTIFLTGSITESNKVKGLQIGGDDYVTKPFSYPELVARIHAVLRRTESTRDLNVTPNVRLSDEPFEFCNTTINPLRLEIKFPDGALEPIGRKELGIISYLKNNPGVVISRKVLIHAVWGVHADVRSRSLDQYIVKVRDLFEKHRIELNAFRTVHGVGYIFDPTGISTEGR